MFEASGIQLAGLIVALISEGFAIAAGVYAFLEQHYRDSADRIRMTQFGVVLLAATAAARRDSTQATPALYGGVTGIAGELSPR
ncbi:hypothetical protein ACWEOI_19325 [Nocardia sp. NPDC004340]|uniref:hypothetical protein n=1 Tax=Nocardia sp. CA-136227 TaxID=3239979 RepID=UPI003D956686